MRSRITILALVLLIAGCAPRQQPAARKVYDGPTDPTITVVQAINRNNQQLPTLWARHYYEVNFVDPKTKQANFVNGDGALLYREPLGFRFVGKKLVEDAFEIGSTDEHYWLKVKANADTLYYGEQKHAGKPCVRQVPVPPNAVLEVLGIGTIGTDFTQLPTPVMRFNPDADAYMFVWVATAGGAGAGPQRLAAQREVWYDRQTKLPTLVILFDANGRPVLRARLSAHKPVEIADQPSESWPKIATDYKLYFPDSGSTMSFQLEDVRLDRNGVPSRRGIVFPGSTPQEAGVREVIKLDQDCTD